MQGVLVNQFLPNKIIASIVAVALLAGVGVLISSGDTSSTTRNAALVAATPCTKPGQVTKVSKQSVVCAALSPKNIWYPIFKEKKWICAKLGITRKQNGIFSVCGKSKSSKKRWFLTKPLMATSNPGLPTTDQEAFIKLTTNPELIVETSPTTPLALAVTTETTLTPTTATTLTPTTETPTTVATTATPATTTIPQTTPTATTTTTTIPRTYQVGETGPGGGIVFYDAGAKQSWGRYLEAAPTDYQVNGSDANVYWGCQGTLTGATATAIGAGKDNTTKILLKCTTAGIAADVANEYSTTTAGAGQWFLPSLDELNELCKYVRQTSQATGGGTVCRGGMLRLGFAYGDYWSSSECSEDCDGAEGAWSMYFGNGHGGGSHGDLQNQLALDKATPDAHSSPPYVRPVRAF